MIELLIIGSLWIWGVHCLLNDGYLLSGVGKLIETAIGSTLSKPLFTCPPCMSIWHGPFIFFLFSRMPWHAVFVYCIALAGLNYLIKEYLYPSEK